MGQEYAVVFSNSLLEPENQLKLLVENYWWQPNSFRIIFWVDEVFWL